MANSRFDLPTVYANLVGVVTKIIEQAHNDGISPDLEYISWDARQDVNELPNHDLIGVADWTYDEGDDHLPEIEMAIILSVVRDQHLFREVELLELIRKKCIIDSGRLPEYRVWTVYDDDNQPFAQLQVTSFSVLPAGESEARTVRSVGISLKRADLAK